MRVPRTWWGVPIVFLSCAVLGAAAVLCSPFDRRGRIADRYAWIWAKITRRACGMRVRVSGAEAVDRSRTYIIVANHYSHLDTIAFLEYSPVPVRMLAKASLFAIPFLGWAMHRMGHVPVLRRRRSARDRARLRRGVERLVRRGQSVVVFAEGSRSPAGTLAPFKKGAFHLAVEFGLPILPVAIEGTGRILPRGSFDARPGEASIAFLPAIEPSGKDADALCSETRGAIARALGLAPGTADE